MRINVRYVQIRVLAILSITQHSYNKFLILPFTEDEEFEDQSF